MTWYTKDGKDENIYKIPRELQDKLQNTNFAINSVYTNYKICQGENFKNIANTETLLGSLAYIVINLGGIIQSRVIKGIIDEVKIGNRASKNIEDLIIILEYGLFAIDMFIGDKSIVNELDAIMSMEKTIDGYFNRNKELVTSSIYVHTIGFYLKNISFGYAVEKAKLYYQKSMEMDIDNQRFILFGIESRQWAYQYMEAKKILDLYNKLREMGIWEKVRSQIYLIAVDGYNANTLLYKIIGEKIGINIMNSAEHITELDRDKYWVPNQWNICADLCKVQKILRERGNLSKKESINLNKLVDNEKNLEKQKILYSYLNEEKKHLEDQLIGIIEDYFNTDTDTDTDLCTVLMCFKDIFRDEQGSTLFKSFRDLELATVEQVVKSYEVVLSRQNTVIICINNWIKNNYEVAYKIWPEIKNHIKTGRIRIVNSHRWDVDSERLRVLVLVKNKLDTLVIGDCNGSNDVCSSISEKSITIGNLYCTEDLDWSSTWKVYKGDNNRLESKRKAMKIYSCKLLNKVQYKGKYVVKPLNGNQGRFIFQRRERLEKIKRCILQMTT